MIKLNKTELNIIVPFLSDTGERIDKILSYFFKEYSRSFLQKCIMANQVFVNGIIENRPDKKMLGGENIIIYPIYIKSKIDIPENIVLDVVYEDKDILVINKPAGLVVHPGAGNDRGTLLNALLYHYVNIKDIPRSGIVHRLDKNTTGLMVVAKTIIAYNNLLNIFKQRKIKRQYQAIVNGSMISNGTINAPIKRHHTKRTSMMVHNKGKTSVTHYKIIQKFSAHTHISVELDTGRTHQIRVHMLYIGYPLVGDMVYYKNSYRYSILNIKRKNISPIFTFPRQALHSYYLAFNHPITNLKMYWTAPLPKDMIDLLKSL